MKEFATDRFLTGLICFWVPLAGVDAATLAGQQVQGGKTVEIHFPVSKHFQDVAAEGGNPRVETGRAIVTFPPGFDPARRWPILIVTSTTDYHRTSPMDAEWYRPPANAELRTAKSSAGETVAMLQPGTPSAQAPLSSPAVRALDAEQIKLLMKQGEKFIAAGDVFTARTAFQRAAEAGDAKAAVAVGATYDPTVLAKLGVVGISADVAKARSWYQKAEKLGSPDARQRLELLADR